MIHPTDPLILLAGLLIAIGAGLLQDGQPVIRWRGAILVLTGLALLLLDRLT